ncbi:MULTISPECIES: hypothetical protein [unclassified Luteimonas]|uniref:hypothetical protein n=1 Tax=unclassified Luteimonas TaxID=2629088 RepID=UPI001601DA23|nr:MULTISPECIES: hypothetical protein [unclassified Luteimonas]MBB1472334.1 hypothetical protein [Luteimonas sp. MC1782]MBB6598949.1 hypothetical protein [Luteimonas sp. MC1825]QOC89089.1 hypothetical protein IDM46_05015 [Luteimonas sp. MC1825]
MPLSRTALRSTTVAALAVVLVATTGCSWFRKDSALFTPSPENRPLEVPPDLDRPDTSSALRMPEAGGVSRSSMSAPAAAMAAASNGFTVAAERDAVFQRVEGLLQGIDGVTVVSKAQLLGTYDIDYADSKFLVRVTKVDGGTYVSAVDPRGLAATGEGAVKVIAALKAGLAP